METKKPTKKVKQKITKRVKTFEDACSIIAPSENMSLLLKYDGIDKDLLAAQAFAKISHIRKVLNEGWEPNWDKSREWKYYPWFRMSGSGLSFDDVGLGHSVSTVGSRLCFKTEELAEYAGKQFIKLYEEYFLIK